MGSIADWNNGYYQNQPQTKTGRSPNRKLPEFRNTTPRSFVATRRKTPHITTQVIFIKKEGKFVDREISRGGERYGHIGGYTLDHEVDQEYYQKLERQGKKPLIRIPCLCGLSHPGQPEVTQAQINLEDKRAVQMAALLKG